MSAGRVLQQRKGMITTKIKAMLFCRELLVVPSCAGIRDLTRVMQLLPSGCRYRMTVLRNLPNLEKLDNVAVSSDELAEAARRGHHIPDSDDEGYPQVLTYIGENISHCFA